MREIKVIGTGVECFPCRLRFVPAGHLVKTEHGEHSIVIGAVDSTAEDSEVKCFYIEGPWMIKEKGETLVIDYGVPEICACGIIIEEL